jgi:hypothetical protein
LWFELLDSLRDVVRNYGLDPVHPVPCVEPAEPELDVEL